MSVKFLLKNGDPISLKVGNYSGKNLCDLHLTRTKITGFRLRSGLSISIQQSEHVIQQNQNNTPNTILIPIKLNLNKCSRIIIEEVCIQETPCDLCEKWDYIIAGLGSAGSILARKLSNYS